MTIENYKYNPLDDGGGDGSSPLFGIQPDLGFELIGGSGMVLGAKPGLLLTPASLTAFVSQLQIGQLLS